MEKQRSSEKLQLKRQLTKQLSDTLSKSATDKRQSSLTSAKSLPTSDSSVKSRSRITTNSSTRRSTSSAKVSTSKPSLKLIIHSNQMDDASVHTQSSSDSIENSTPLISEASSRSVRLRKSLSTKESVQRPSPPSPQLSGASSRSQQSRQAVAALTSHLSNASTRSERSTDGVAVTTSQRSNASIRSQRSAAAVAMGTPQLSNASIRSQRSNAAAAASQLSITSNRSVRSAAAAAAAVPEAAASGAVALEPFEAHQLDVALVLDLTDGMGMTLDRWLIREPMFAQTLNKVFEDHPGVRIAVILHADVGHEYRACIKQFSSSAAEVMQFLQMAPAQRSVDGMWFKTDSLVIELVQQKLHWEYTRRGLVVMVADVMPHDVFYYLTGHDDHDIIDWKTHSDCLLASGVKLCALQMYEDRHSSDFWREWLRITGGTHVSLNAVDHRYTPSMIFGMCIAELGVPAFNNFEAHIRNEDPSIAAKPELFDGVRPFGATRPASTAPPAPIQIPAPAVPIPRARAGGAQKRKANMIRDDSSSDSGDGPSFKRRAATAAPRKKAVAKRTAGAAKRTGGAAKRPGGAAKRPAGAAKRPTGAAKRPAGAAKRTVKRKRQDVDDASVATKRPRGRSPKKAPTKERKKAVARRTFVTKAPDPAVLRRLSVGLREDMPNTAVNFGTWSKWKAAYTPFPPPRQEAYLWEKREPVLHYGIFQKREMKQTGYRRRSLDWAVTEDPNVAFLYEFAVRICHPLRRHVVSYSITESGRASPQCPDAILFNHDDSFSKIPINLNHALNGRMTVYVRRCAVPAASVDQLKSNLLCYPWIGQKPLEVYPRDVIEKGLRISRNVFY